MRYPNIRFRCAAAAVAFASFAGCEKPPARVEPPPPKVTVAHPEARQIVASDDYNGWMQATASVDVRARVRGHIDKIHFTDGQMVKSGQILFGLAPRSCVEAIGRAEDESR